ncbi:MAG: DUF3467 domain-containing protein [Candidatus Woesearchaeota archaeon]
MTKEDKKNVNMNIQDGDSFFAHELSINFNPMQFIFDFKNITPRVDPRSQENMVLSLKHNVIMMDPWQTKRMISLLDKVIKDYEKEFGKITKPKQLEKYEKKKPGKKSKAKKDEEAKKISAPSYFG